MAQSRTSILLTGFGSFPGVSANATALLIPELAEAARGRFPVHDIVDEILPVEWQRAPQLVQQLIKRTSPKLALHFGVSKRASGFQIELVGRNICDLRIDAAGDLPSAAHLIDAGPDELPSSFPARRIIARLESAGLPWATSESAGSYVCNALLYHSLISAKALPTPCLSGFVHLPVGLRAGEEAEAVCALSWSQALSGSLEIIAACLEVESIA